MIEDVAMNTKKGIIVSLAAAVVLSSGCATQTGSEESFGDAVRTVTHNQTYDKNAAANPSSLAITGGNGDRIEQAVEAHAENVSAPSTVSQPIRIGVGQQ
jgi:hypothetical protein